MTLPPLASVPEGVAPEDFYAACAAVRAYCGWHIAPSVTETVTVDGSGGFTQFIPTLHLTDVASIANDGTALTTPEWSEFGMIRFSSYPYGWTCKFRGVVATITHGYDQCPTEILPILTRMARNAGGRQASSESAGGETVTWTPEAVAGAQSIPLGDRAVLDRLYRIPAQP